MQLIFGKDDIDDTDMPRKRKRREFLIMGSGLATDPCQLPRGGRGRGRGGGRRGRGRRRVRCKRGGDDLPSDNSSGPSASGKGVRKEGAEDEGETDEREKSDEAVVGSAGSVSSARVESDKFAHESDESSELADFSDFGGATTPVAVAELEKDSGDEGLEEWLATIGDDAVADIEEDIEDELARILDEDLVPPVPDPDEHHGSCRPGSSGDVHPPAPPDVPPGEPAPPGEDRDNIPLLELMRMPGPHDWDGIPLRALMGAEAPSRARQRGTAPQRRTVDKYPRLVALSEEFVPDGNFHGIRVVKNPLLHAGKWDSMRAICGFHGARCELSRALTINLRRPAQGRPLCLLWAWLDVAHEFDGEDAAKRHKAAGDPRTWPVHRCRSVDGRKLARAEALRVVSALPEEERAFFLTAERPQRPGEPEEPDVCP